MCVHSKDIKQINRALDQKYAGKVTSIVNSALGGSHTKVARRTSQVACGMPLWRHCGFQFVLSH